MEGINVFYEFNGIKNNIYCENVDSNLDLYNKISIKEELPLDLFKLLLNGKFLARDESKIEKRNDLFVNLHLPLIGGKGGFGSMLRAIGAQIEKTTNKEACRDLSGRRLRDVKAEKRIKNWIKRKADQQKEQERKKREKLERLTQAPKIEFKDDEYLKQKDIIPEKVDDAIDYFLKKKKVSTVVSNDLKASSSSDNENRLINSEEGSNDSDKSNDKLNDNLNDKLNDKSDDKLNDKSDDKLNDKSDDKLNDKSDEKLKDKSNDKLKDKVIKRKQNEPAIISKKKKVTLFLGDDLDSSEEDE